MLTGAIFHGLFARLGAFIPYLIFTMLFITFCRVSLRDMRFTGLHLWLIVLQLAGGLGVYMLLRPLLGETVGQGAMICVFAPVATAAVVVAGMLGANVATMATFSLLSNIMVACVAPVLFSFVGSHAEIPFWDSFLLILRKVVPLLIGPLVAAQLLERFAGRLHAAVKSRQQLAFYLWSCALTVVSGRTVNFIVMQGESQVSIEIILAVAAAVVCLLQFAVGRWFGRRWGDTVAGGQSLGQKNTILAIWMAQTYLDPISSVAPAAYVLWQNLVNSWQISREKGLAKV